jgi:hypothetical protein
LFCQKKTPSEIEICFSMHHDSSSRRVPDGMTISESTSLSRVIRGPRCRHERRNWRRNISGACRRWTRQIVQKGWCASVVARWWLSQSLKETIRAHLKVDLELLEAHNNDDDNHNNNNVATNTTRTWQQHGPEESTAIN